MPYPGGYRPWRWCTTWRQPVAPTVLMCLDVYSPPMSWGDPESLGGQAPVAAPLGRGAKPHAWRTEPPSAWRLWAVIVGSRLAVLVVVALWTLATGDDGRETPLFTRLFEAPWKRRDAGWFVAIARHGYVPNPTRAAFFPLYPLAIRIVSHVTLGHYYLAGMVVSLAAYVGAMLLLSHITAGEVGRRAAFTAVLLISVFPTAFVFGAVYSEALFLLLSVALFFFARRGSWALAGLMGFLAGLTRSTGILLFVPLVLLYAEDRGWTWRRVRLSWPRDLRLGWTLLAPAGLLTYMGYLWWRVGDPLLFATVQGSNWRRTLSWPWVDVWRGADRFGRLVDRVIAGASSAPEGLLPGHLLERDIVRLMPFCALVSAVICLVFAFRHLRPSFSVYAALAVLFPLAEPAQFPPSTRTIASLSSSSPSSWVSRRSLARDGGWREYWRASRFA